MARGRVVDGPLSLSRSAVLWWGCLLSLAISGLLAGVSPGEAQRAQRPVFGLAPPPQVYGRREDCPPPAMASGTR